MKIITKILIVVFLNAICSFDNLIATSADGRRANVYRKYSTWSWKDFTKIRNVPPYNEKTDVQFWLFSKQNPDKGQLIKLKDSKSIKNSNFDKNKPTHVLIHGWDNDLNTNFSQIVKNATVKSGDFNVIVVDWGKLAHKDYPIAARRTRNVGATVGNLLNFWWDNGHMLSFDNVTIVGHSLGAHVAGVAGKNTRKKVAELYGLDAAAPLFFKDKPEYRMDKNDAQLTVALRTDTGAMGYGNPLAHMEFFPNGGQTQPGCESYVWSYCSHRRAFDLYAESLLSDRFVAKGCSSFDEILENQCTPTGVVVKFVGSDISNKPGYYFFTTNPAVSFGLGDDGLQ